MIPTTQASVPRTRLNGSLRSITRPPSSPAAAAPMRSTSSQIGMPDGCGRADRADDAEPVAVVGAARARAPGGLARGRDRPVGLPDQHGRVQQHERDAGPPVRLLARDSRSRGCRAPPSRRGRSRYIHGSRAVHDRVPDAGVEDHDRRDDREDVRDVGRDRRRSGSCARRTCEAISDSRSQLFFQRVCWTRKPLNWCGHVGRAARGRLVDDAVVARAACW